jgi:hypothetical protein
MHLVLNIRIRYEYLYSQSWPNTLLVIWDNRKKLKFLIKSRKDKYGVINTADFVCHLR